MLIFDESLTGSPWFERNDSAQVLLRTGGAAVDPNFHLSDGFLAGKRRESTAIAWIPAPGYEFVVGDVFEQLL